MVYVFGTVISGVSCTLANNWAKLFWVWGEGGTYLKTGAIRTFTVHVFDLIKKDPLPSPLLSSLV